MPTKYIFATCMLQIDWYSETFIIFPIMIRFEQNTCLDNINTSLSINCLNFVDYFMLCFYFYVILLYMLYIYIYIYICYVYRYINRQKDRKIDRSINFFKIENCPFISKYVSNKLPPIFNSWFMFSSTCHNYETSFTSKGHLKIPTVTKTTYGKGTFISMATKTWNNSQSQIKDPMINTFSPNKLKIFLASSGI